ncbi:MAG TPA: TonB-dependent receptor [Sphingomonas sp.]|jgi:TonB-dependent receptor|uniref:TonB-dependent receptor n=1 Tax=Sphingomonas sp. TaxID=28214 RepID=UPI002EDB56FB
MRNAISGRRRTAVLLCATALAGGAPLTVWAQAAPVSTPSPTVATPANPDQTTAADPRTQNDATAEGATPDVVVTGFRQSYADAIRTKRNDVEISDGISSDGLGRFPDLNVGEALQRVPGVQINREAEGRNATINLRGLPGEYARLTLNGVAFAEPILTDAAPLGAFNSDIFSAIRIEKSPMANAQTGGLSGNVDLQIAPALGRKDGGFAKAGYEYNQLGKLGAPSGTIGYNYHISENLAVFGVLAYRRENFRRDTLQYNTYSVFTPAQAQANAATLGAFYPTSAACPSCTGSQSTTGVIYNSQLRQYSRLNEGDLLTGAGGFEFAPTDTTKFGVTGFYTDRNQPKTRQLIMIYAPNQDAGITTLSAPEKLSDGRTVVQDYSFTNPDVVSSTRLFGQQQKSWGLNANGEWKTEDWRIASVSTYSKAANRSNESQLDFNTQPRSGGNGVAGTLITGSGNVENFSLVVNPNPSTTTVAPNGWFWGGLGDPTSYYDSATPALRRNRIQFTGTQSYATNKVAATQADIERFLGDGFLSSVQMGFRYEHNKYVSEGFRTSAFGIQTQNIDPKFLIQSPTANDFFQGNGGQTTTNWQVTDVEYAFPKLQPVTVFPGGALSPLGYNIRYNDNAYAQFNFTNQTDIAAIYGQMKYEFELGGIRIRGNGGLRYELAKNKVLALNRVALTGTIGSPADFRTDTYRQNYNKLLPSFIAVADLTDKLIVRGAAYKTYVRPQPRQFSPVTVVGSPNGNIVTAILGNPNLKPYDATSFDTSIEWYNRPNGIVSLALFQKRIKGLIGQITDRSLLCPADGSAYGLGTLTVNGDQCQSSLIFTGGPTPTPFLFVASGVLNQDNPVTVRGAEFNLQQNLDFLPGVLKNLGGGFNYAITGISGKGPNGAPATLPGVSKHNMNLIGYYETPVYGVRLVYNYRTAYDLASAGTFTGAARSVKARGQLDLSASYNVTSFFSLSFDAFNLTNALRQEFENDPRLLRRVDYDGRTFAITGRATF